MTDNMEPTGFNPDADTLAPSELRVVLVCDVVESVRWMEQDEDNAVTRWQAFTQHVRSTIVPAHGGSVVKSTGDGMMIEFPTARGAVQAAAAMHAQATVDNAKHASVLQNAPEQAPAHQLQLRTGIHETQARRDAHDLYGHGVNLAARITTLAGPGETIVSAPVRDHLTDALDGDIEDMGECYLKHVTEPQRVFRVGTAGHYTAASTIPAVAQYDSDWEIAVAVMPFDDRGNDPTYRPIGDLVADVVISQLSKTAAFRVVSRLSSVALKGRGLSSQEIQKMLGVHYLVGGSYTCIMGQLIATVELSDARNGSVLWSDQVRYPIADLLDPHSAFVGQIVSEVHANILRFEFKRSVSKPLPTVESYTLLLGSITMMHRMSRKDFNHARLMLEHLIERHSRNPTPRAWMAKWHSLAIAQRWSLDPKVDAQQGQIWIASALDLDPTDALALTIKGLLHGYVEKEFDEATASYAAALQSNPSEPLAWIGTATLNAWKGDGAQAVVAAERAISLSPLDPIRYYFESLAALAMLSARKYEQAIDFSTKSLRVNAGLSSTRKVLAIAQVLSGNVAAATSTVAQLLRAEPAFSIAEFSRTSPGFKSPMGPEFVVALEAAGVPTH